MDNLSHLDARERQLQHRIFTDGTVTLAQLFDTDDPSGPVLLAEGSAKRRRGDKRDSTLGASLALSRAYTELAAVYLQMAGDRGAFR